MLMRGVRHLNAVCLGLVLALPLLLALHHPAAADALSGPVPRATCGPNDRSETGLQGQTTRHEKDSGLSEEGFNCNLELVGQYQGEGASWMVTWFGDCAYYNTFNRPGRQHPGTVVVDASDPRDPQATALLDTPTMIDPWESLTANKARALLAGVQGPALGGPGFAIYDITDCADPVLKASVNLPDSVGHGGTFAPDGMTYYGTGGGGFTAIDIADPSNPRQILRWIPPGGIGAPHDLSISEDGNRAYVAQPGNPGRAANGLVILDVSDVQSRRPNPQIRVISTLFWEDGSIGQGALPVTIRGRPYVIFTDELGSGGSPGGLQAWAEACARGLPPFSFARIIDISDEWNPRVVSKLMLEVHDPANCLAILNDPPGETIVPGAFNMGYSSHYCSVDNERSATMAACSYFEAGIRVFDISDPFRPREIAYYKPPARRTQVLSGSLLSSRSTGDRSVDWASSEVRFRKHRGEPGERATGELWFTSSDNGFQIVKFTNGVGSPRCSDPGPRECAAAGDQ